MGRKIGVGIDGAEDSGCETLQEWKRSGRRAWFAGKHRRSWGYGEGIGGWCGLAEQP